MRRVLHISKYYYPSSHHRIFYPDNAEELASIMARLISGDKSFLAPIVEPPKEGAYTSTCHELLAKLIK